MALPPEIVKELIGTFRVEMAEQLRAITDSMLTLEKESGDAAHKQAVDAALRGAHNIKGGARGIGIPHVGTIAHHTETVFTAIRDGKLEFTSEHADICLEAVDRLQEAMTCFEEDRELDFDVDELVGRLEVSSQGKAAKAKPVSKKKAPPKKAPPKIAPEADKAPPKETAPIVEEAPVVPANDPMLSAVEDSAPEEPSAVPVEPEAKSPGKPIEPEALVPVVPVVPVAPKVSKPDPQPAKAAAPTKKRGADVIRVATTKVDSIAEQVEEIQAAKIEIDDHIDNLKHLQSEARNLSRDLVGAGDQRLSHISVSSWHSDGGRVSALKAVSDVSEGVTEAYKNIRSLGRNMGLVLASLQDHTRSLRLVPATELTRPLARTVRDNARKLNKPVNFEVSGEDTEMDRGVLEMLQDPMLHLLRNAIDHGIESSDQRAASSKSVTGTIKINFQLEGAKIKIEVSDDGAGIDVVAVKAKAVKNNLISKTEADGLEREEALDLIFRPGLSTKEIVTDLSGRGVGLDVVRSNLEKLNASISVDTVLGEGTTFILRVPLTLAAEQGIIVRAGGQQFAIPSNSVDRVLYLASRDVVNVEAGQAYLSDGKPIPLRNLADTLEISAHQDDDMENLSIVLVSSGWRKVAFVVDEIIGQREMVVKPLQRPLVSVRNVSGGTIAGGGILLVLNTSDLLDSALSAGASARIIDGAGQEFEAAPQTILVVDDSLTTRTMLKNIMESRGFIVSLAINGQEAWTILQDSAFDLIVTDVEMPVMDGFELTDKIKQHEKLREIPVIIVTSQGDEEHKRKGVEVGADAYIVKGDFEAASLINIVGQLI